MERKKTDSDIEQWVLRELGLEKKIGSREVCVLSCDGVVTLNGSVQNDTNKSAAEEAAHRVGGVVAVVNNIRLKPCSALIRKSSTTGALAELFMPSALVPGIRIEHPVAKGVMP